MTLSRINTSLAQDACQPANSGAQDGPHPTGVGSLAEKPCDSAGGAILPGTGLPTPFDKATREPKPQPMSPT